MMPSKTCTGCGETKTAAAFSMDRRRRQRKARCTACTSAAAKAWRQRNPGYEKARYQADKVQTRERHLVRKYKVTLAVYAAMLERQGGRCAICAAPEAEQFNGVFHVDHCHATGAVRGLLCRGCNHVLGLFKDNPALFYCAAKYLSSRKSRKSSGGQSSPQK